MGILYFVTGKIVSFSGTVFQYFKSCPYSVIEMPIDLYVHVLFMDI